MKINILKRASMCFCAALTIIVAFSNTAKAKVPSEKLIGIIGGYNTYSNSAVAGINFQYRLYPHFRIAPNFQYIFKRDGISAFQFNINTHYPFRLDTKLNFYPIAGLTYQRWRHNTADFGYNTENKFGANVGAGLEYMATPTLKISIEGNYSLIKKFESGDFFIGLGYLF